MAEANHRGWRAWSPLQVDYLDAGQVRALVGGIDADRGRRAVLVNGIWGASS